MVPMTEQRIDRDRDIGSFYDRLAPDYDQMTGFEKRFVHEKPFFRLLVERYGITTAIDAGCGTGFHSFLLAQLGVAVTAVDVSPAMIRVLHAHAQTLHLPVKPVLSSFANLTDIVREPVDALFCLGNSIAHLLSEEELRDALASFAAVLRPGGIAFLQTLNYDRIMAVRERVQSVKEAEGVTYVRFYDYEKDQIRFNLLRIANGESTLSSVRLRPVLQRELFGLLDDVGLSEHRAFGGIAMEEYNPQKSKDLVVLARKAG